MFTHHAQARMQQRGIPTEAVDALLAYGASRRHNGADVYYLDRQARSRAKAGLDPRLFNRIEKALDTYLIVGEDGVIITAAHRLQRLKF